MHNPVLIQWEKPTVLTTSYVSVVKIFFVFPIMSRPANRIDNDIYNHNAAASGTSEAG